ncbi:transposase [Pandoraea apista]|nr:transposase [Pandoraea apista]RRW98082.1 transposase [Pandoraea apista]
MARRRICNELWKAHEPLLPVAAPSARGGRPRVENRAALNGMLFVLGMGTSWEDLPQKLGSDSRMTSWR